MDMDDELLAIQRLYPQIYHACHVRHVGTRRNAEGLSERDQSLLAHLAIDHGRSATDLARHFGVGLPTLSEALTRLEEAGHVERRRSGADRRVALAYLTPHGASVLRSASVLDDVRLRAALERLSSDERRRVIEGLELLAQAAGAARHDGER